MESAVFSPFQGFGGEPRFSSPYDVAAAQLANIATGHHFHDGNKRTALLVSLTYLRLHENGVAPPSDEAGAKLVEDVVIQTSISYDERRICVRSKLQEWTVPDETARKHRARIRDLHAPE